MRGSFETTNGDVPLLCPCGVITVMMAVETPWGTIAMSLSGETGLKTAWVFPNSTAEAFCRFWPMICRVPSRCWDTYEVFQVAQRPRVLPTATGRSWFVMPGHGSQFCGYSFSPDLRFRVLETHPVFCDGRQRGLVALCLPSRKHLAPGDGRARAAQPPWWGCNLKIPQELSFRSAALSREESAASLSAASRFLVDKAGFGMTRWWVVSRQTTPLSGGLRVAGRARPSVYW
jgi:hypothetical protein